MNDPLEHMELSTLREENQKLYTTITKYEVVVEEYILPLLLSLRLLRIPLEHRKQINKIIDRLPEKK